MGPKKAVTKRDSKSNGETNVAKETKRQLQKSRKDNVATEINDADVAENSDEESQKETVADLDQIPDKKAKRGKAIIVAQELKYSNPDEVEEMKDLKLKNEVPLKRGKRGKATEVESSGDKADIDNDGETASSAMNVNGKSKRAKKVKNTDMEDKTESIENKVASDISNANEGQSKRPKRGTATVNYDERKTDVEGKNAARMQSKRQKRKKVVDELNEEDAEQGDLGDSEEKGNKKALVPEEKAGKKKKANQKVNNNSTVNKNKAEPLAQEKQNEELQDDLGESSGDEVKPKKAKAGKVRTVPQKKKLAKGKKSLTDDEEEPDTGNKLKKIAESLAQEKQNEEDQEDLGESSGDEVEPKVGKAKTQPQKKKLAKGKKSLTDDEEEPDNESLAQEKQSENEEEENIKDSGDEVKLKKRAKAGKAKSVPQRKTGKMTEGEGELEDSDLEDKSKKAKESKSASEKVSQKKVIDVEHLDFSNHSTSSEGEKWNLKITSWNVNGIRSWLQKDGLKYLHCENPDVMCVQETKCADDKLPTEITNLDGYHCYWLSGDNDGYSGVGLLSKEKPIDIKYGIDVEKHDNEGRVITAEFEKFILVESYIPNAGRGLVRLGYRQEFDVDFRNYLKKLDEKKPIVLCGDLNVAHKEIDLANPKTNKKTAGFTIEEREGFTSLLDEGFVDSFRHLYPEEKNAYTFWSYMASARAKNIGWRLDYFVLSQRFVKHLCDNVIRKDVLGSDHCPVTLFLAV